MGSDAERAVDARRDDRGTLRDDAGRTRGERNATSAQVTPSLEELRDLLRNARTIAVVGLSPKPIRPSYSVSSYMQRAGYRIIPINPGHDQILGERSYPTLEAAARDHEIDVVDVFRRSAHAGSVVD